MADVLNEHFIAIKVDREERPDVDRMYMTFVQATTGGGGWPMSVWLMPDLKPVLRRDLFPAGVRVGASRGSPTSCSRWRGCGATSGAASRRPRPA